MSADTGAASQPLFGRLTVDHRTVVTRLAVTPAQVAEMGLATAPPKKTDRRSFAGETTTQAEAIPPDVLSQIVRDAITSPQCPDVRADMLDIEAVERAGLIEWAANDG